MKDIQVRLMVYFSIILLVVSMGLGIVAYTTSSAELVKDVEDAIMIRVDDGSKLVASRLQTYLHSLEAVARRTILTTNTTWDQKAQSLRTEIEGFNYVKYKDIGIATLDGKYRTINGQEVNISDRDYFIKASQGIPTVSDPVVSRLDNTMSIALAVPVRDKDNNIISVLIGTIKGTEISSIVKDIVFGDTGYAFVINNQGTIIAHPNDDKVLDAVNITNISDGMNTNIVDISNNMISRKRGIEKFISKGIEYYIGYVPVEKTSWSIGIVASKHELHQRLYNLGVVIGRSTFIFLVGGVLISILVERRLIKSIDFIKERLVKKNTKILVIKCKERTGLIGDIGNICGNNRVSINDLVISRQCDIEEDKDCLVPVTVYFAVSIADDFSEERFFSELVKINGVEEVSWKKSKEISVEA